MILWILIYYLVGVLINFGSIFTIYGKLAKLCGSNVALYNDILARNKRQAVGINMNRWPTAARFIATQTLWPLNVFNTLRCGLPAIKEAKEHLSRTEQASK